MQLQFDLPKNATRIWDVYVPIVHTDNGFTAYLTNQIADPEEYNELCFLLNNATPDQEIELVLNTPGGMLDSALMIMDAIKNCKATVKVRLTGTVASAGTIIALACNKLEAAPHLSFMIHNYSGGVVGKAHEIKSQQDFTEKNLTSAFKSFYDGFLTPREMKKVIKGEDMWMNQEEVLKRWNKKLKENKKEQ